MGRKIKILQFPIANSKGGITRYALNIWSMMDKAKFQCDFATLSTYLDFEDEITTAGSKVHYISCYAEENQEQFTNEFRDILNQGYDVVHLYTAWWKSFLVERLCMELKIPKVIVHAVNGGVDVLQGNMQNYDEVMYRHEQVKLEFNVSYATDFWACSKLAADFLFGEQIPREKIKIMPVPIDITKFGYDAKIRNSYRKKYDLEDCFVIGHVGRFEYQKNHEFLINVFYEVSKLVHSAKLLLLGDGKLMAEIKSQVKELDIEDKVIFLGKFEDVCDWWYQVMDVFCLPSRFEGQPAVLIEAQASYLPCVYSDLITSEATVNDNVSRLPLDVVAWKEKLIELSGRRNNKVREQHKESSLQELQNRGCDIKTEIKHIEEEYLRGLS